jgi:hypothetical protein
VITNGDAALSLLGVTIMDPIPLRRSGRPVRTVFDLLGTRENDVTASLGYTLARSPGLTDALAAAVLPHPAGPAQVVRLQQAETDGGITDVEIDFENGSLIMEAKRGWTLPSRRQLARYRPRLTHTDNSALLSLSECSPAYATPPRLPTVIDGVPVRHLSWKRLAELTGHAHGRAAARERRLLEEFGVYLRGIMTSQNLFSTWTYCVSVGTGGVGDLRFRGVVTDKHRYFHPYGVAGWPTTPPNFLAFRWAGAVQRVHHVEDYRVVPSLRELYPQLPATAEIDRQHAVYTLGPDLTGGRRLPNGAKYRSGRLWVALDLLLTSATLKDALTATRQRRSLRAEEPA